MSQPLVPTIHARGVASRLDAVLELVAYSARPRPLTTALDELPRRIGQVFSAQVCSIYLLEGDDLVMRGNVGFPPEALGEVRLSVGEGVTGLAVEYMRPISLDAAPEHKSYRHFPALGEDAFPIFLAVPVAGPSGPLGALVLQRKDGPAFDKAEVELAAALTAPIAAIAERARLVDALKGNRGSEGPQARRVTLSGRSVVSGRAVGQVVPLPRPHAQGRTSSTRNEKEAAAALDKAIATAVETLETFRRAANAGQGQEAFFDAISTILDNALLRERALELVKKGDDLPRALNHVGAEAMRAANRVGDLFGIERAKEMVEVCEALSMLVQGTASSEPMRGAVLVGDAFTVFDLIVTMRAQPAAVVLSEHAVTAATRALLSLVAVPAVVEVAGLFRWVGNKEIALVDGDHGLVRLNPSRAEISTLRTEQKQHRPGSP